MTLRYQPDDKEQRLVHDLHVYGVITIVLDLCLCVENLLPVFVVIFWRRPRERTVSDKLLASLSAIYILSALVPTPLGLASYFHGSWYGGIATCECFQVTSTWCSLSALAVVTYLSIDLHLTACTARALRGQHPPNPCSSTDAQSSGQPQLSPSRGCCGFGSTTTTTTSSGKDMANVLLFFVLTVTLVIASLPVVGYGPQVMSGNSTCDSWLIDTPRTTKRRAYFVVFLSFGFLNLLTVVVCVLSALHKMSKSQAWRWEGEPRYTEETRCHSHSQDPELLESSEISSTRCYRMAGLILANQAMWIPALVIVTVQKAGYPVTDATMMYTILSTSLPGLLNPLLLGLLYRDYRQGYRYLLLRLCCCCVRHVDDSSSMKNLRSRSTDSLHQLDDGELSLKGVTDNHGASSTGKSFPFYYPPNSDDAATEREECNSFVVVEMPNERTPLQGPATTSTRPIVASLYDEYGELSGAPKTELLSPCGSEECLLNPELFRTQTESVV